MFPCVRQTIIIDVIIVALEDFIFTPIKSAIYVILISN